MSVTVRRNIDGFARYALMPRVFTDVADRDLSVSLLGERLPLPLRPNEGQARCPHET